MSNTVTLHLSDCILTGVVDYNPDIHMLQLVDLTTGDSEVLSIDLPNVKPASGCVFVKDYSEHSGLPEALANAGVAEIVQAHRTGPYAAPVAEMKVL
ncbi:hypothetical protein [Corynebacterium nasicanis]|uniref:Uncharacterized protein n=1 Tax=Corynebacterium nasicanis TaxID=1448267 RepID=A0ABW1Q9N9_9CORY